MGEHANSPSYRSAYLGSIGFRVRSHNKKDTRIIAAKIMEADIANVLNHVKFSKGFPLVSSSADGAGVGATVTSSIPGKI